jgi:23S rRNA (guanine745-N1)-methyltransferase
MAKHFKLRLGARMLPNSSMNIIKAHNLACPIDGKPFVQTDKQFVCENGHTYDIARQGYVNLLPVHFKRSRHPGDSKAMIVARTHFLATGIYQAIADKLNEIVLGQIINDKDLCILDAGCGEGFYFDSLMKFLNCNPGANNISLIGLDISKDAIVHASKRTKQVSWIVGTNRQPPLLDESVDIIICMFGFVSREGFNKILKPGGIIILLDPGDEHLKQLREVIYPVVNKQDTGDSKQIEIDGFAVLHSEKLLFNEKITSNEQVNHLLIMTPHFYRASKEGRDAACQLSELEITVDVDINILKKQSS